MFVLSRKIHRQIPTAEPLTFISRGIFWRYSVAPVAVYRRKSIHFTHGWLHVMSIVGIRRCVKSYFQSMFRKKVTIFVFTVLLYCKLFKHACLFIITELVILYCYKLVICFMPIKLFELSWVKYNMYLFVYFRSRDLRRMLLLA
jgi:hypothetical protein